MFLKNHRFLKTLSKLGFLFFFVSEAPAITLTAGQTDYTTSGNINTNGNTGTSSIGINSSLSGNSSSLNKIKNTYIITTGNSGATSSAYGIKSTGAYNQITNDNGAVILTTGNSGRGISITNNSTVTNSGSITTQGTTSYGIAASGNGNNITNSSSGSISTTNTTSYGIYLDGSNNLVTNAGSISTQVYGIYAKGDVNQISNSGTITTTSGSSAHGIYVSAGSSSTASSISYSTVDNSGTISSNAHGIYVKDNYTQVTNSGSITPTSGSSTYGIRIDGDNSTVTNSGSVTATNYAIYNAGSGTVINNLGTISGGINLDNGTLNILGGSISGIVDASSGNINVGSGSYPTITFNQVAAFNDINTLTISSGSSLNSSANITAGTIEIDTNSTLTISSQSSLSGAIQGVSNSVGTLNISGVSSTPSGTIGISGKSLANLNINSGGSLTSSSSIYASNILLDGSLNFFGANNLTIFGNIAGSGSGVINIGSQSQIISGTFTLNSGDELAVTLKNAGVGNLTTTGAANIDANSKLAITPSSNQGYITSGTQYTLLSAASGSVINSIPDENISVNGVNSNIYGLLAFSTTATSNALLLNIDRLPASQITSNQNSQNIYQALSDIGGSSSGKLLEFQEYLDSSGFSGDAMTNAINQLAPQSSKASLATVNNVVGNSVKIVETRLEKVRRNPNHVLKNNFWGQGFGGSTTQQQISSDDGYGVNSMGISFGLDNELSNNVTAGASASVTKSDVKHLDNSKQNLIDTYQVNIYNSQNYGKYFVDSIASIALNRFNSSRAITALGLNANASYYGQTYAFKMKSGFVKKLRHGFSITPEASVNILHDSISGYAESGANELNLNVGAVEANFVESRGGLNLGYSTKTSELPEFKKFSAILKTSYGYALVNDAPTTTARFTGKDVTFNSQISHLDRSSLKLGFELAAYHEAGTTFSVDYNLEHKATSESHVILAKIRQEF